MPDRYVAVPQFNLASGILPLSMMRKSMNSPVDRLWHLLECEAKMCSIARVCLEQVKLPS